MPALELRDEEIGFYDPEAAKARRERLWGKPKPVVVRIPAKRPGDVLFPQKPRPEPVVEAVEIDAAIQRVIETATSPAAHALFVRDVLSVSTEEHLTHLGDPIPVRRRVKVREIQKIVAMVYGLTVNDILSKRRTANVVKPRQEGMWLAKRFTLHSLPEIGRQFGGKDHTTVLHAVRKIERLVNECGYEAKALPHVEALAAKLDVLWRDAHEPGGFAAIAAE
jgi:hypothetical protein